ncbi:MAG: TetR/AcrR family transcriptional regulator [Saprospiraceae bacterium]
MPPRIKTEKEREELRQLILDEAERTFIAEGYVATSLRKIAKRIGYSAGTIYLHFDNKDNLFYAVQERAFTAFHNYLAPLSEVDPLSRIRQAGDRYLSFALKNPEYYDLMFIHSAPMNAIKETAGWQLGTKTFDLLERTVQECMDEGYMTPADSETVAFMIWSAVHGMCSLYIRERLTRHLPNETVVMMHNAQRMMLEQLLNHYSSTQHSDDSAKKSIPAGK